MKYVVLKNDVAMQIIPEFDPDFPKVPITQRYPSDFLKKCIVIHDEVPCQVNWIYDRESNRFYEPSAPSPSYTLAEAIKYKCDEINVECGKAIAAGFDFGGAHYSLTENDQINILGKIGSAQNGEDVSYHADGEECRLYAPAEFLQLARTAEVHKTKHTTYCNLLKLQVETYTDVNVVYAVKYGVTELTGEYKARYDEIMGVWIDE